MNTNSVKQQILTAWMQSAIALNNRITQDENQQTFSATYLGDRKIQLANGDIRTADFQGTRAVSIGESVTVTFPLHSQIGYYSSKIA